MNRSRVVVVALALLLVSAPAANAHELPGASATLVVREGGFVQLKLQLPWSEVLHRQWMPNVAIPVFLGAVVNQPPATFAASLAKVQATLERDVLVIGNGGRAMPLARWAWPAAADVQTALRNELMARLAMPNADHHGERFTASAEARVGATLSRVQMKMSAVLGTTLLTVYRPTEQWLGVGALSAPVDVAPAVSSANAPRYGKQR